MFLPSSYGISTLSTTCPSAIIQRGSKEKEPRERKKEKRGQFGSHGKRQRRTKFGERHDLPSLHAHFRVPSLEDKTSAAVILPHVNWEGSPRASLRFAGSCLTESALRMPLLNTASCSCFALKRGFDPKSFARVTASSSCVRLKKSGGRDRSSSFAALPLLIFFATNNFI